jgi:spore maturation protein CgeB
MRIVIFGLAITSSWGNGHATTYRALGRALHARGHRITFFERNVEWYASNRDLPQPDFCQVHLYDDWAATLPLVRRALNDADVAMVGSYFPDGIAAIEESLQSRASIKAFYDIDTPVTLAELRRHGRTDYLLAEQVRNLDLYLSFTGGTALQELQQQFGARRPLALYCSVDPCVYRRVPHDARLACALSYMGTYAPDRQPKLQELLCAPAQALTEEKFIVAGPMYPDAVRWPRNVEHIAHLEPKYHPCLYSSSHLVLNLTRREMARVGHAPSVRLFEAAACGAAIVSDNWPGLDELFCPGQEILLATSAENVIRYLQLSDRELRSIGEAAQARILAEHSNDRRARQFEEMVQSAAVRRPAAHSAV